MINFKTFHENYADKKVKGKSRPGRVKKSGASCKGSVTELRKKAKEEFVRFRTLGCYPLSGAVSSTARSVSEVITEIKGAKNSERKGRLIDVDSIGSMEQKKRKGYF